MRGFFNSGPGRVVVAVLVVSGLAAAIFAVYRNAAREAPAGMDNPVQLKCIDPACGHVMKTTIGWANTHWNASEEHPVVPGSECPGCKRNTLAFVDECQADKTLIFRSKPPAQVIASKGSPEYAKIAGQPTGTCPVCKWDPAEALRQKLKQN